MWSKDGGKMKKKLGKKWGKIRLFETSAVGIPMYPGAVNKSFRSLIKALRETEEEIKGNLNLEKSPMEEGEAEAPAEEKSEEKSEEKTEEVAEENPESKVSEPESEESEEKSEEKSKETEEVDKSFTKEAMMEMMTKGFQAAIKASATPRGLIDNETKVEKMEKTLAKKSLGEIAVMNGMFKAPDMYGRVI